MPAPTPDQILALDVGSKRIGVALANGVARLPQPLTTIDAESDVMAQLERIIYDQAVGTLVVGLPRGLDGQETAQTGSVRKFAETLERFNLPVHLQDEALTSQKAEAELKSRGAAYNKADVDALAATYILDDFINGQIEEISL